MSEKKTESLNLKLSEKDKQFILFAADKFEESAGTLLIKALRFYLPLIEAHPVINTIINYDHHKCQHNISKT